MALIRRRSADKPPHTLNVTMDGDDARVLVMAGPDSPSRGALLAAERWKSSDVDYLIRSLVGRYEADGVALQAVTAPTREPVTTVVVDVDESLVGASEPQRRAAALAATSWPSEDVLDGLGLTAAIVPESPGSDAYTVATAPTAEIRSLRERFDVGTVRVTSAAYSVDSLFRSLYAGELADASPILVVLANVSYFACAVLEGAATVVQTQFSVSELVGSTRPQAREAERAAETDALDAEEVGSERAYSDALPDGFEAGGSFDPRTVGSAGSSREARAEVDVRAWRAALRQAVERTSILYSEAIAGEPAFATDISRVYVTGAGVERFSAVEYLADLFASQARVSELEAARITFTFDDPTLAREIATHEGEYGDALALAALDRRPEPLVFEPDAPLPWVGVYGEPEVSTVGARDRRAAPNWLAPAALAFAIAFVPVAAAGTWVVGSRTREATAELESERARAEALKLHTEARTRQEAQVAEVEENNRVCADAERRQKLHLALWQSLMGIYSGSAARLDECAVDAKGGIRLVGVVRTSDELEQLLQRFGTYGTGAFSSLDGKQTVVKEKALVLSDGTPVEATAAAAPPDAQEANVERFGYTITATFNPEGAPK